MKIVTPNVAAAWFGADEEIAKVSDVHLSPPLFFWLGGQMFSTADSNIPVCHSGEGNVVQSRP